VVSKFLIILTVEIVTFGEIAFAEESSKPVVRSEVIINQEKESTPQELKKSGQESKELELKKRNFFGITRIETGCWSTSNAYHKKTLSGGDSKRNQRDPFERDASCASNARSNWLRLNWVCPDESTSFVKAETNKIFKSFTGTISMLDSEGESLQKIPIITDEEVITSVSVTNDVYDKAKRMRIDFRNKVIVIERDNWPKPIVLTKKMCSLGTDKK
jgi:hypothetical protein